MNIAFLKTKWPKSTQNIPTHNNNFRVIYLESKRCAIDDCLAVLKQNEDCSVSD
jgi:hypothetical protein